MGIKVLLVVSHNGEKIDDQVFNTVTAISTLSSSFDAVVLGHQCDDVVEQASRIPGVKTVHYVDDGALMNRLSEVVTEALSQIVLDFDMIVFASNTTTKNILPRLAAKLDISPITDVCEIVESTVFKRPIYAGNIIETVSSKQKKIILSIRSASFQKTFLGDQVVGNKKQCTLSLTSSKTQFVCSAITPLSRPELSAAKTVVSGGRGLGSAESFDLVYQLADKLDAAVGASRAAVDAGFVSNDYQVGQTGKIIAPDLYIAIGISGAIQHLSGMKDSRVIIAINKDEDAPIFQSCDYGLVGDLFDVVPKLLVHLSKEAV